MEREEHRRRMERDRHEEELRLVRDTQWKNICSDKKYFRCVTRRSTSWGCRTPSWRGPRPGP